jgi:Ion channel
MSGDISLLHMLRGVGLLGVTVIVQATFQVILTRVMAHMPPPRRTQHLGYYGVIYIVVAVGTLAIGLMADINVWAILYYSWGELGSYANSVYFSIACFTTIGASDLSLSAAHRVVGAQEAAVGMLMFGWTTALMIEVISSTRAAAQSA